jgi:Flp pilus assembly protein TadD
VREVPRVWAGGAVAVTRFGAVRGRPDDAETWSYLGLALLRQGDRRGALEAHDRLRELDPGKAEALRARIGP